MKFARTISAMLVLLLLLSATLPGWGEKDAPMYEAETLVAFHLRAEPESAYRIIEVPKLTRVTVYGQEDGWYRISYKNEMGWAKAEWLWAFRSLDAARYPVPGYAPEIGTVTLREACRIEAEGFRGADVGPGTVLTVYASGDGTYTLRVWRSETEIPAGVCEFTPFTPWQDAKPGDLIGGFTTYYHPRQGTPLHEERQYNIALGCGFLDGAAVQPGATFSFNALCGPYKKKTGYKIAVNISQDGQGYGGGVCQVSTTLFNAVLGLPLQVTQWSAHRYTGVDYAPVSFDAAVGNSRDFQFVNMLDYPIRLWARSEGGAVTVLIYRAEEGESRALPSGAEN